MQACAMHDDDAGARFCAGCVNRQEFVSRFECEIKRVAGEYRRRDFVSPAFLARVIRLDSLRAACANSARQQRNCKRE